MANNIEINKFLKEAGYTRDDMQKFWDSCIETNPIIKSLNKSGTDVLICDHHEITTKNPYAIIINHHLGDGLNTALSGTGVMFKLIDAYCEQYDIRTPDYTDMVAVSLVSDICDLTSIENRAFINNGLLNPSNKLLAYMAEKLNRKGNNPEGYSWGLIPPGNALSRSHNQEDKEIYFNALVGFGNIDERLNWEDLF